MSVIREFDQLGYATLDVVDIRDVRASSTSVLLVCAFWRGAANQLRLSQGVRGEAIDEVMQFLQTVLSLDDRAASHLLRTEARLRLKYALLADVSRRGAQAAQAWLKGEPEACHDLRRILHKYDGLSLMELDVEGVLVETENIQNSPVSVTVRPRPWIKWLGWAALALGFVLLCVAIWRAQY